MTALPFEQAPRMQGRSRRIALFGGSFDPIHVGHLAVARVALRRFQLDAVHFIPSGCPPHKHRHDLAPFPHRYAMVALAAAENPRFVPSLVEAGPDWSGRKVFYSVETVRNYRQMFRQRGDHLYFILGADSFLEIHTWKDYATLLDSCDFIVASRPGFRMDALRRVVPRELLRPKAAADRRAIALRRTTIYLLDTVRSNVSATEIRRRLEHSRPIRGLVPPRVEEYICQQGLYYR